MPQMNIQHIIGFILSAGLFSCSGVVWIDDGVRSDTADHGPDSQIASSDSDVQFDAGDFSCVADETDTASIAGREINFVIAVDTSAGMEDEVAAVEALLNGFIAKSVSFGMAPRTILISADGNAKSGICIALPTGSGACPEDSNPPDYVHINQAVGSKDALSKIVTGYDLWKETLYPGALVAFIVVTDDESEMDAETFQTEIEALDPSIAQYAFYAIASSATKADACAISESEACCSFGVKEGASYKELSAATQGLFQDLCLQEVEEAFGRIARDAAEKTCSISTVI